MSKIMTTRTTQTRDQTINIRASRQQREVIDQAAQALGKSRSEFMLETAMREAESMMLDQVYFQIDETAWKEFIDLLEAPPAPSAELRKLLHSPSPWE